MVSIHNNPPPPIHPAVLFLHGKPPRLTRIGVNIKKTVETFQKYFRSNPAFSLSPPHRRPAASPLACQTPPPPRYTLHCSRPLSFHRRSFFSTASYFFPPPSNLFPFPPPLSTATVILSTVTRPLLPPPLVFFHRVLFLPPRLLIYSFPQPFFLFPPKQAFAAKTTCACATATSKTPIAPA